MEGDLWGDETSKFDAKLLWLDDVGCGGLFDTWNFLLGGFLVGVSKLG